MGNYKAGQKQLLQYQLDWTKKRIDNVSVWLDILLFIYRYNFTNVQNEIFGYIYENYLKDLYSNENKGQFFTNPHIVDFMLDEIGYTKQNIQARFENGKDTISIIDPACGSGTFLYNACYRIIDAFYHENKKSSELAEQLIQENVFGLDISEFPLYLAEMSLLMRMLPIIVHENYNNPIEQKIKVFKTKDSIAEFLNTMIHEPLNLTKKEDSKTQLTFFDYTKVQDLGYQSHMRDTNDLHSLKQSLAHTTKIVRKRFDYVIGNPPYISYNECASQKLLFFDLKIQCL